MDYKHLINLCIAVLKDWKVIFIAIFTIAFMMTGSYVVKYRRRPPRVKQAKKPAPAPAAPAAESENKNEEA